MKATCPTDKNHKRFLTVAHVMEEWVVDECGDFLERKEFLEVVHEPDVENLWICAECGADAKVEA